VTGPFVRVPLGLLLLGLTVSAARAQPPGPPVPRRVYVTRRAAPGAIVLDGRPTEAAWDSVAWSGDFTQRNPYENRPPSEATDFKILYDDDALYVAYRAWDREPARIRREMARRDWFPGDWVEINIDSRGDQRTAFSFTTSVSGVRGDEYISENGSSWDASWDPIWRATTAIDERGWTAEIRIPFSQLRYCEREEQVWGIEVTRRIFRHEERSVWQFIPQDCGGWCSNFGELRGIRGLRAQKQIELLPYAVGRYERLPEVSVDRDAKLDGGLDGKVGLSGNMILDLTVNPDFGQVEADPAQVNLSAFETYFEERRPFFIEGSEVLSYPLARAITGGSFTTDRLFYSRRIGRAPQGSPALAAGEFAEVPTATSILGAAKVSGKTAGGLSIGMLEAVTSRERAEIRGGRDRRAVVEPVANSFVARAQQEYDEGRTLIGGMVTALNRDIADPAVAFLHTAAYAGGVDLEHRWNDRTYHLRVRAVASHVRGSREALRRTQTASAHYFQRPDAESASLDTTRTSLSGLSGSAYVGKGNGRWRFQTGAAWRSPGFEINDLGYLRQAGELNQSSWIGFYLTRPFSIFRDFAVNGNQWLYWDADGRNTGRMFNLNTQLTFRNEWSLHADVTPQLDARSNTLLRGGPSFLAPGGVDYGFSLDTDPRRAIQLSGGTYWSRGAEGTGFYRESFAEIAGRPSRGVRIGVAPSFVRTRSALQYVAATSFDGAPRYLLATIAQRTASLTLRLDYAVTPGLTVQYYAQPFVSAGDYSGFKRVTTPLADRYADRTRVFAPGTELAYDAGAPEYRVDEDRDGETDYAFADPDFNYRAFNSNLVVRWEYRPGSTIYLVWSQTREGTAPSGRFRLGSDADALFDATPRNVFLIKVSRWWSI
jgi:hypothetical protein